MKGSHLLLLLALGAGAAAGAAWWTGHLPLGSKSATRSDGALPPGPPGAGLSGRRGAMRSDGPVPVLTAQVARADVDVFLDGIGTVQADASVTVRAQVEGRLIEVRFTEGQEVAAGDVLAVIDPGPYRAVWEQAVAKRDQNRADLASARADLERYDRLAKSEAGSRQQADQQRAAVAKLEAQTRIDAAVIDAAKIDLDNTTIRAPIAGRTGLRTIDVGNLVRNSDTSGLVTVARLKPIAATFTVAQQRLGELLAAEKRGPIAVEVLGPDRRSVVERGEVTVIDNQVDAATGTVKLKARLPNRDETLWPGQFVDLRIALDRLKAVPVIPSAAVQRTAEGPWVWVVDGEAKVRRRSIELARQDETRAVIKSGLSDGETVVTTGFARLSEGAQVKVDDAAPEGAAAAKPAPAPGSEHRRRKGGADGAADTEGKGGAGESAAPAAGSAPAGAPTAGAAPAAGAPAGGPRP